MVEEIQAVMNSHLGWQDLAHGGSVVGHGDSNLGHDGSVVGHSGSVVGGGHG